MEGSLSGQRYRSLKAAGLIGIALRSVEDRPVCIRDAPTIARGTSRLSMKAEVGNLPYDVANIAPTTGQVCRLPDVSKRCRAVEHSLSPATGGARGRKNGGSFAKGGRRSAVGLRLASAKPKCFGGTLSARGALMGTPAQARGARANQPRPVGIAAPERGHLAAVEETPTSGSFVHIEHR